MSTGYTREQLSELSRQIYENVPPEMTAADLKGAAKAIDISMAATDTGILLRLGFKRGEVIDFFLNCAVTLELVLGLHAARERQGWWLGERVDPHISQLELPSPEDLAGALDVISLRTASEPKGVMIAFSGGATVFQFNMRRKLLEAVLGTIALANDRACWWDDTMALIPNDGSKLQ